MRIVREGGDGAVPAPGWKQEIAGMCRGLPGPLRVANPDAGSFTGIGNSVSGCGNRPFSGECREIPVTSRKSPAAPAPS